MRACPFCSAEMEGADVLAEHLKADHAGKSFCVLCGKEFKSRQGLKAHRTQMHGTPRPKRPKRARRAGEPGVASLFAEMADTMRRSAQVLQTFRSRLPN